MVRFRPKYGSALKWLLPGMQVKRWLLLLFGGITILSLGAGYILVEIYRTWTFPPIFYYLTLQFIPRPGRALLFGVLGITAVVVAIIQVNRSLLSAFRSPGDSHLVDIIYRHRHRSRGPKVVAIGGGIGLSTLLRGLKEYTSNITAIVTVADDGGSSGLLRRELGVLPPGDFRNCIAALADAESLTTQLFQYRFSEGKGLNGHSFGNLFIAAMAGVTGNFERAILESGRVLAIQGQIFPSTLEDVTLCADLGDEEVEGPWRVEGESEIPKAGKPIERVYLIPGAARAYPGAVRAILEADLIVAGPGSLYTSVLPNLLVPGIVEALRASKAIKVYVCNVATQKGETDHFCAGDHIKALEQHVGRIFDHVLLNNNLGVPLPSHLTTEIVSPQIHPDQQLQVVAADVVDRENPWRHDSRKLARVLLELYYKERNEGKGSGFRREGE